MPPYLIYLELRHAVNAAGPADELDTADARCIKFRIVNVSSDLRSEHWFSLYRQKYKDL